MIVKLIYALGDTNNTTLASIYVTKPFIHDKARMRSFDNSMVEDVNRRAADAIANFRHAPTKMAVLNLLCESILPSTIELVGSTVVDALLSMSYHVTSLGKMCLMFMMRIPHNTHFSLYIGMRT
jgi:UDP-N-acetylglucosamine 2-epimerase (non-hydrolysing)